MILSKASILAAIKDGLIRIEPFDEAMLKEASYSFTLAEDLALAPGQFAIAVTKEKLTLSPGIACILSTRGMVAQQGIDAVQSSVFCEPDTDNPITLELVNHAGAPVTLKAGTPVVKGIFFEVK